MLSGSGAPASVPFSTIPGTMAAAASKGAHHNPAGKKRAASSEDLQTCLRGDSYGLPWVMGPLLCRWLAQLHPSGGGVPQKTQKWGGRELAPGM